MSQSLKEQLLALGLASTPRVSGGGASAGPKERQRKPVNADLALDQAYRLRAQHEKEAALQKKEEKRLKDLENRRINKQIQALVEAHKRNDAGAEFKRNFMYKGRIRSVLVMPEQLRALNAGELGVVFLRGGYYLLAPQDLEQARAISPDHVPDLSGAEPSEAEDERFKVPDDLVW